MLISRYDESRQVNVGGYAASMASYATLVTAALTAGHLRGRSFPERSSGWDLLLGGVATHKLSRLLAKGSVASPLRAPFTEFAEAAGLAEHHERRGASRGCGTRSASC